jgi:hypothetical protein
MTQIKFTIESGIVSAFKARCAVSGISMAEAARQWMKSDRPTRGVKARVDTRPHRRRAVEDAIRLLEMVLQAEQDYRDAIPEVFQSRLDSAGSACEELEQAIECLGNAF